MSKMTFHLHSYSISCAGHEISLLRKEFEVLQFLYEQVQKPVSREQLLNAIWSMESPVDRTVDDHIYRLRKKLKPIEKLYTIDTIRGHGYQLTAHTKSMQEPLILDPYFKETSTALIRTYHLYGNGQAIQALLTDKTFGIEPPREFMVSIAFMKGDFDWIVHTRDVPFSDRLLFLLHLFLYVNEDMKETLHFYERAIEKNCFSERTKLEAETLLPVYLYLFAGEPEKVELSLQKAQQEIDSEEHGFYPFFCICKLMYGLCMRDTKLVDSQIVTLDEFFNTRMYLREKGIYSVVRGIHYLLEGSQKEGNEWIQEGFSTINQSQFVTHNLLAHIILRFFFNRGLKEPKLKSLVEKRWQALVELHDLYSFRKSILEQFHTYL